MPSFRDKLKKARAKKDKVDEKPEVSKDNLIVPLPTRKEIEKAIDLPSFQERDSIKEFEEDKKKLNSMLRPNEPEPEFSKPGKTGSMYPVYIKEIPESELEPKEKRIKQILGVTPKTKGISKDKKKTDLYLQKLIIDTFNLFLKLNAPQYNIKKRAKQFYCPDCGTALEGKNAIVALEKGYDCYCKACDWSGDIVSDKKIG